MPYTTSVRFLNDIFYDESEFAQSHQITLEKESISYTLTDNPNADATLTLGSFGTLVGGYFCDLSGTEDFIIPLNTTKYIEVGYNTTSQFITTSVVGADSIETIDQKYKTVFRVRNISGILEVLTNKGKQVAELPYRGFIVKDDPVNIGNYELFNFIEDGSFVYTNNIVSVDAVQLINVSLKQNENYKIVSSVSSVLEGGTKMYVNNDFALANYEQHWIRGLSGAGAPTVGTMNIADIEFGFSGVPSTESMSEYTTCISEGIFLMTGSGFAFSGVGNRNVYVFSYRYLLPITEVTAIEIRKTEMLNNSHFYVYKKGEK